MKKIISIIMALSLFFSMGTSVFANPIENTDTTMEDMVVLVKNRLEFQESKTFKSTVSDVEDGSMNKNVYILNWEFEDNEISVNIRDDGFITEYSNNPKEYNERKSLLFSVTKEEAKQTANAFIKKINPDVYQEYEFVDIERMTYSLYYANINSRLGGENYVVSYIRKVNGIPFKPDIMTVYVSGYDNYVTSYNGRYHENIVFDTIENHTQLEQVKSLYKQDLDLEYIYEIKNEYIENEDGEWVNNPSTVLVYRDKTTEKYIDATTGKLYIPVEKYFNNRNYGYVMDSYNGAVEESISAAGSSANKFTLTEEEKNEILDTKDVIQPEEIINIVKNTNKFNISESYIIGNYRLFKNKDNSKEYSITLVSIYNKNDTISMRVDANTGKVSYFRNNSSRYYTYHDDALTGYLQYAKDLVKYSENNTNVSLNVEDKGLSFRFTRIENNILCPDNYISITVDKETKLINHYEESWTDVEFVKPDGAFTLDQAKDVFINNFEYSLFYYLDDEIGYKLGDGKSRGILAWSNENNQSTTINAHNGEFLNYSLKPLTLLVKNEEIKVADYYTDINNHWAKDIIKTMQNNDIGVSSNEFKPDEQITYKDLFELLGTALTEETFEDFKSFIIERELVGLNFITENTLETDKLTREQFCALMVCLGNYNFDRIIDKSDFFKTDFTDNALISSDKIGYVAIARMLNYISSGTFRPLDNITRAEAITYLYNIYNNL